ncbi:concanavalin A-like lectin/glucanase [Agrocybe pediades]|nr:concanavalin A-like lectin/glucanase [Agrocybe pediades]
MKVTAKLSICLLVPAAVHAAAGARSVPSEVRSVNATASCKSFVVPGVAGGFTNRVFTDFSGVKAGDSASSFLSAHGFSISNYGISDSPVPHTFVPGNVLLGNGVLQLKVSAYSGSGAIKSAEVASNTEFKYGSVRTILKSSSTPGVVEGNFFYANDNQEIDWEILTSTIDTSSSCVPAGIWATNQALVPGQPSTHATVEPSFDPRTDFHEYRIDWTPDATTFFLDGKQVAKLTTNVPTVSGPWIWNAWSNGDVCWSNGPPKADSITQIKSIEMYTGYSASLSSANACQI